MMKYRKILFGGGLALLGYGTLCRLAGIRFFWESRYLGWMVIFAAIMLFLIARIRAKRAVKKSVLLEGIGVFIIALGLLTTTVFLLIVPHTDAYEAASRFLMSDERLSRKLGTVRDVSIVPAGSISVSSGAGPTSGHADFSVIVKGGKKYRDMQVSLVTDAQGNWMITEMDGYE